MRLRAALFLGLGMSLLAASLLSTERAQAADLGYPSSFGAPAAPITQPAFFLSEVRLGTFAHDAMSPEKGSADLAGEILFARPFTAPGSAWDFLLPRPSIGATISFAGKTSQAFAGLTWTYDITKSIFVEAEFGGSVNNGKTGAVVPPGHNAMGCQVSFRESASLGYRLNANWDITATVEHMSNAGLCTQNRGLTNYGARIGYSF
ncbi:MAG: acyloxyacyl hydrolase [Hyphomicrobiales bacterium]